MVTFGNMTQNQVQPNCQTFSTYNVALIDEFLEKDATITRFSAYITATAKRSLVCESRFIFTFRTLLIVGLIMNIFLLIGLTYASCERLKQKLTDIGRHLLLIFITFIPREYDFYCTDQSIASNWLMIMEHINHGNINSNNINTIKFFRSY